MTPSARLQSIIELLEEIRKASRPTDAVTSRYFRGRRYIGSKDRGAISSTLYDLLRHHARLGWWLGKKKFEDNPRACCLLYLWLVEKKTVEDIVTLFNGQKFAPGVLMEDEVTLLRNLRGHTLEHPSMPEAIKAECPDWAATSLKKRFGDNFMHEMQALLMPAPLDIRVNTLKATRDDILVELKTANIEAEACKLAPFGIRIKNRPSLMALPMLKDGRIEIQDEGSQLIALLTNAEPGQKIVDFCAGAGGKSLAIAAQMNNKGRLTACDVMERRLKQSTERFRRAGIHNIEIRPLTNERDPWIKRHKGMFDCVLVDAPCSGTGAWRRAPDSRWRGLGPDVAKLLIMQQSILESAARLVKPGGRLIYATCSLLPEENQNQVERFLNTSGTFKLLNCETILRKIWVSCGVSAQKQNLEGNYLSLTPYENHTDGFFASVMECLV